MKKLSKTLNQNKKTKSEKINQIVKTKKDNFDFEEHKANLELHLSLLGMPYYNNKKIKWTNTPYTDKKGLSKETRLIILFHLPRNSLYILVEFCKLNQINISYDCHNICLDFTEGFKTNYDVII